VEFKFKSPCKIIVCGDSISAGIVFDEQNNKYIKSKEGFVTLLQNSLNCAITNISRFGNTLATAMPRLKRDMEKEKPDVVLIELGGNDCDFKWDQIAENPQADWQPATNIDSFQNNLSTLVGDLRKENIAPVLMTLPPLDPDRYFKWVSKSNEETGASILEWLGSISKIYWWQERYNAAVLKVIEGTNAAWIDLRSAFLSMPDFRNYLCKDGIHPNKEGHELISRAISNFLRENYPMFLKPVLL
jgi:lysophospholipase L1-like esterase